MKRSNEQRLQQRTVLEKPQSLLYQARAHQECPRILRMRPVPIRLQRLMMSRDSSIRLINHKRKGLSSSHSSIQTQISLLYYLLSTSIDLQLIRKAQGLIEIIKVKTIETLKTNYKLPYNSHHTRTPTSPQTTTTTTKMFQSESEVATMKSQLSQATSDEPSLSKETKTQFTKKSNKFKRE
jgi:hypothetical protein